MDMGSAGRQAVKQMVYLEAFYLPINHLFSPLSVQPGSIQFTGWSARPVENTLGDLQMYDAWSLPWRTYSLVTSRANVTWAEIPKTKGQVSQVLWGLKEEEACGR